MEGNGGCDALPSIVMLVFGRSQLEGEGGLSSEAVGVLREGDVAMSLRAGEQSLQ